MLARLAWLLLLAAAAPSGAQVPPDPPPLQCDSGPIERNFGEVPWKVFACDDGATIVVVTGPSTERQLSFYFIIYPKDGAYALHGEGNGDRNLTRPAYEALSAMTPDHFRALHAEAAASGRADPAQASDP